MCGVPPAVAKAMAYIAREGPVGIKDKRERTIQYWEKRRSELEAGEKILKQRLHPDVQKVVGEKNVLLFKEMLEHIRYDDLAVVELLTTGVPKVGQLERTGMWPPDPTKAPRVAMRSVWAEAKASQKTVLEAWDGDEWNQDDQDLWDESLREESEGNLQGPFSPSELASMVGPLWVAARRFPIRQGEKLRPIDDFSEFSVNAAFGSSERVRMKNLDQVVSWSRAWLEAAGRDREFSLLDSSGAEWRERLHEDWGERDWMCLVGRVADLKQAYKQLPASPAHAALNVIAVKNPNGGKSLFRARTLMFGQAAAVYGFLRFSRAIAALGR